MELIILGSGTHRPQRKRHPSSCLLRTGGKNLVFDFGRGVLDQLLKVGVEYFDLDAIFITHAHADHCSELGSLLHIALAEPSVAQLRKKDVTIYGPRGFKKSVGYLLKAFFGPEKFNPQHKVEIKELKDGEKLTTRHFIVESFRTQHSPFVESSAYRIKSEGRVLAYSGDSRDCAGLRKALKDVDLAVLEATWPDYLKPSGHLSPARAAQIAKECEVKRLVLTHISPYTLENVDARKEAKKFFSGPLLLAKDLMKIKV